MSLSIILGSGVVAGLVAGLVTLRASERKIAMEHITKQREIWRDKIRTKSLNVTTSIENKSLSRLSELHTEFFHLLNPLDQMDTEILNLLKEFKENKLDEQKHIEFIQRISLLLKHDWQRAKREAKPWFFFAKEPKRISYAEYIKNK
ncbi:TPA: hypothetical protein ACSP78_003119 [Aeromonas veronii]